MALANAIGWFLRGKACEVYHAPFDVRLPEENEVDDEIATVVQPDVVVVCDPKKLDDKGCRGAPDLVIEVLSPSTASKDCIKKRALYERHRVREFWIADPANRVLSIYLLGGDGRYGCPAVYGDEDEVPVSVLPGLTITLGDVFPKLERVICPAPRVGRG